MNNSIIIDKDFLKELRNLITEAQINASRIINNVMCILYWQIGNRINQEILKYSRADYGDSIVSTLSRQLSDEFGRGYSEKNIWHMIRFANIFPDFQKVSTLSRQLSWSHFKELIYFKDDIKLKFYIDMCNAENWSVRQLRDRINSMLFERTALSDKPINLIENELNNLENHNELTPDVLLKDPYILDFLGLKKDYLEKDFEDAILKDIQSFILELGTGFSFIERQKRIIIDNEDYYIDLLFYNRKLKRLFVIELKNCKFKAEHKGQMELYLRWLDKYERQEGENSPIGIIMCTQKSKEQIELLEMSKSGIHVAEYLTVLPSKELLNRKLNTAILNAKQLTDENKK